MVNDVAKLTQSVREGVVFDRARASLRSMSPTEKRRLRDEIDEKGHAVYRDHRGNRYRIERKPL